MFLLELVQLRPGFHALDGGGDTQLGAQVRNRADDGTALALFAQIADEGLVDLDLVEGKGAQVAQRGIAGAEVIHDHRNTGHFQPQQVRRCGLDVGDERVFGDLQFQSCGRQASGRQRLLDNPGQVRLRQLRYRQIDRNLHFLRPAHRVAAGLAQHPVAQRHHQADVFGQGQELGGVEQAALRMAPAQQRFEAGDAALQQVDQRLVVQFELLLLQAGAQLDLKLAAVLHAGIHLGLEEPVAGATFFFGPVQRQVGIAHQFVGGIGLGIDQHDADAGADQQLVAVQLERPAEHVDQTRCQRRGGFRCTRLRGHQHR